MRQDDPDALERPGEQAVDLHLRDPHVPGDLMLREVLPEPQGENALLARGQGPHRPTDHVSLLHTAKARVLARRYREWIDAVLVVKRAGEAGFRCDARFDDLLDWKVTPRGELARRRVVAELRGQLVQLAPDGQRPLLPASRHMDAPCEVAAVALQLPDDRRDRVGGELHPAVGIEALERSIEAQARHLEQV